MAQTQTLTHTITIVVSSQLENKNMIVSDTERVLKTYASLCAFKVNPGDHSYHRLVVTGIDSL